MILLIFLTIVLLLVALGPEWDFRPVKNYWYYVTNKLDKWRKGK